MISWLFHLFDAIVHTAWLETNMLTASKLIVSSKGNVRERHSGLVARTYQISCSWTEERCEYSRSLVIYSNPGLPE